MNGVTLNRLRRLRAVLAIAVLGVVGCGHRDAGKVSSELKVKKEIDLGIILDTTLPLELSIPITNRANRKLTIIKLSKDCSCTAVTIDKVSLSPGETANLHVVTNLAGKTNSFTSDIIVESDSLEKMDEIMIHGQITGQIRIRPQRATLLTGNEHVSSNFTVFCDDQNGKWKYTDFSADDSDVTVTLSQQSTSPTISIYNGLVDINPDAAGKQNTDYRESVITLNFVNEKTRKSFQLKYPVDIAVRRKLMMDPPQVTLVHTAMDQKRTILVQSEDPIHIDSVVCDSPCVKAAIRWIDTKTLIVELVSTPVSTQGDFPKNLKCNLLSGGKTIASIPVSIVNIP